MNESHLGAANHYGLNLSSEGEQTPIKADICLSFGWDIWVCVYTMLRDKNIGSGLSTCILIWKRV